MGAREPRVIELSEATPQNLERNELDPELAHAIHRSKKLQVEFPSPINKFQYQLTSPGNVGQVPITRDLVVRITPKVPVGNIFAMLELAYNLKSFQFHEGLIGAEALPDVFERLADILAKRVLVRARKGFFRDYVDEDASLGYVRGRIDIRETTRLLMGGGSSVHCRFQENTADLDENQILLWTLRIVSRMGFQRPEVVANVRAARRAITGFASVRKVAPTECINRFYNRLNQDYQPMHGLCRFFLEAAGPGLEHGKHDLIPFTVHMPGLFETFVAEWLKQQIPKHLKIKAQHSVRLTPSEDLQFRIDLVLIDKIRRRPVAVLDTKYKRDAKPSESDIQQVVAYAEQMGVDDAYLIYPSTATRSHPVPVGRKTVRCIHFDLGKNLDEAGRQMLEEIIGKVSKEG